MKPLRLFLKGFAGIASGLRKAQITLDLSVVPDSAKLVVLAGHNGAGKSTILDNLQPYRIMPSRCKGLKPSAFSYWDELCDPVAQKQLDWEHDGVTYRSDIVFKVSGKTRSQSAYLFELTGEDWKRVVLPDGTRCDGSVATYDRCLEHILGRPEVFFTTAFAAWKRRMLAAYDTSDIKTLVSAWLGHESLLETSGRAREVADLLKLRLAECQAQLRESDALVASVARAKSDVAAVAATITKRSADLERDEQLAMQARAGLAQIEAKVEAMRHVEVQRAQLQGQVETERKRHAQAVEALRIRHAEGMQRFDQAGRELKTEATQLAADIERVTVQIKRVDEHLNCAAAVTAAQKRVPELQTARQDLMDRLATAERAIAALRPRRVELTAHTASLAKAEADGLAAKVRVATLTNVAALAERVPCVGSTLQPSCELLKDALTARSQLDAVVKELVTHRQGYARVRDLLKAAGVEVAKLDSLEAEETTLRRSLAGVLKELETLAPIHARAPVVQEAREQRPSLVALLADKKKRLEECRAKLAANANGLDEHKARAAAEEKAASAALTEVLRELEARAAALPRPVTKAEHTQATQLVAAADAKVAAGKGELLTLRRNHTDATARLAQATMRCEQLDPVRRAADLLAKEVAAWELTALAIGKDGLVAFSIDDAGPEISAIANDLIVKCYDANFVLRFETQPELRSGAIREGFEILVRDTQGGSEKAIDCLSGGQELFVNDCLTRAVCLYLAQCGSSHYDTLFSDEADGPLDEQKKRQFVAMKRKVLDLGNYSREYFVSQTKEVQSLADHVIDVTTL